MKQKIRSFGLTTEKRKTILKNKKLTTLLTEPPTQTIQKWTLHDTNYMDFHREDDLLKVYVQGTTSIKHH